MAEMSTACREMWLWLTHLEAHLVALNRSFAQMPTLTELTVVPFADPNSSSVLLLLRWRGTAAEVDQVRTWARCAGLQHLDNQLWSRSKRVSFVAEVNRFKFDGESSHPLVEFCGRIASASMKARSSRPAQPRVAAGTMSDELFHDEPSGCSIPELDFFSEDTVRQFSGIVDIVQR